MLRITIFIAALASLTNTVLAADHLVSTPSAFYSALTRAEAGDNVLLAPGDYGSVVIDGLSFTPAVTIRAEVDGAPPHFSRIEIRNSSGLHLSHLFVSFGATAAPLTSYAVQINDASDIELRNTEIVSATDGVAGNDAYGVFIRDSNEITLAENVIHDVFRGAALFEVTSGIVRKNVISKAGSDGIVGRGLVNVSILENLIWDFNVIDPVKHHPDGVQIWSRGAERTTENVMIAGNLLLRSTGDPFQGIFIKTPEEAANGVTIENNIIHQSMAQGIYVDAAKNIVVANNTVTPFNPDTDKPGLEIRNPAGLVHVEHNIASAFRLATGVKADENIVANFENPFLAHYTDNLISSGFEGANARPEDFRPRTTAGAAEFIETIGPFLEKPFSIFHRRHDGAELNGFDLLVAPDEIIKPGAGVLVQVSDAGRIDGENFAVEKTHNVRPGAIINFTFDNGVIDAAPEPLNFSGAPAAYGEEDGQEFATFNGLKKANGGVFLTSDTSGAPSSANDLTIEARLRRENRGGWQVLAAVPSAYEVRIKGDQLRFSVWNEDGAVKRVTAYTAGVSDGEWHDVQLAYTAETGLIQIIVDNVEKVRGFGPGGAISYQPGQRLYVGGVPWMATFEGDVAQLKITR